MSRRVSITVLLGFALIILMQRVRLSAAPLHGDICAYAVLGHEMLHGRQLYSDLWERKPPLLYITYAAAELITGYGRSEIFLLGLTTSLATLLLIYLAGQSDQRGPIGGLFAAGFWMLLNCDLDLAANQTDPEVFINVCLTAGFLLLVSYPPRRRWISSLLLGAALSAATLFKHNTAIVCGAMLIGHVAIPRNGRAAIRLADSLIAGSVMLAAWAVVFGYFIGTGRGHVFVDVLFHQNVSYSGSVAKNLGKSADLSRIFPSFMIWALAPALLILVLAAFAFRRVSRRLDPSEETNAKARRHQDAKKIGARVFEYLPVFLRVFVHPRLRVALASPTSRGVPAGDRIDPCTSWWLLLAWAVGTWPTIALTGYVYPHYYQLWLPIGCIAGGWAAADLLRSSMRVPPIIRYAALMSAFAFLIFRQGSEFLLTPEQWVHRQFPYFDLVRQNQLGVDLGNLLKPDQQFWELGEDNALYFFSKHSPPTGLLFIDPFIYGDETQLYWTRLLGDLNRTRPVLVILSDNWTQFFPADAPIFPWLKENYSVWDTPIGWPHYRLLVRHGTKLDAP
jgi:hypothetical protein